MISYCPQVGAHAKSSGNASEAATMPLTTSYLALDVRTLTRGGTLNVGGYCILTWMRDDGPIGQIGARLEADQLRLSYSANGEHQRHLGRELISAPASAGQSPLCVHLRKLHRAVSTSGMRQLRSLIMSRTARSSPEGLGARRHLAAIIDRLPQLPSPLSVERLQKRADSISALVYAVARCRAAGPRTLVRI
jgi:hypothetical protein